VSIGNLASRPTSDQPANTVKGDAPMKKIFLAVALVVAFAAPAMAEQFPNAYSAR
jgi:hypothetical protein